MLRRRDNQSSSRGTKNQQRPSGLTTVLENQMLRKANEELTVEVNILKKGKESNKVQEMKLELDALALRKANQELTKDNEQFNSQYTNDDLTKSLENLKRENETLRTEMERLKALAEPDSEPEEANEYAVPLNKKWNSLSIGNDMYDSVFSFKVDTPEIWPDPLVWNIIYAAVPAEYSIPDPEFTHELARNVAWGMLQPTLSSNQKS